MKTRITILLLLFIVSGCSDDQNLLEDIALRGGYVQFKSEPDLTINTLELDNAIISEELIDPNNNIIEYSLTLYYEDMVVEDFVVISSFPATLELTASDFMNALGITEDDISVNTEFTLVANVTTPTGTYSGLSPNFNNNNVNQGGDTTVRLKATGLNDAMEFNVTFFQPPGKTIRRTSFEEVPVGPDDAVYDRNGSANETADLINGTDPPFVDYTAQGTSADDEIGFDSEFVAVPDISSSSLGFFRERIGVFSLFEDYDEYPDGTQGYHIEDPDGMIRITFDTVEVPEGQNRSGLSFWVFFGETSWESRDGMYAYINVTTDTGSEVIEMVDLFGDDVEAVDGVWNKFDTGYLRGVRSYQLVIEANSGATPESFDIDNILVYEPEN